MAAIYETSALIAIYTAMHTPRKEVLCFGGRRRRRWCEGKGGKAEKGKEGGREKEGKRKSISWISTKYGYNNSPMNINQVCYNKTRQKPLYHGWMKQPSRRRKVPSTSERGRDPTTPVLGSPTRTPSFTIIRYMQGT